MLIFAVIACSTPDNTAARPGAEPATVPATVPQQTDFDPTQFTPEAMPTVPLLGGTLAAIPDLNGAVAADPDGNRLVFLPPGQPPMEVALGDNARPFRIEVQGSTVWVTLRGTGEVAQVDARSGAIGWRSRVCPEPRGTAHAPDGTLVVACAGGELVALDGAGAVVRTALLPSDLRDVVSADGILYVSRFRPAEILLVDPTTFAVTDVAPLGVAGRLAWRMRGLETGGVIVVYDEISTDPIVAPNSSSSAPEYYVVDTSCQSLHQATFATVGPEGYATTQAAIDGIVLPVDFTIRADGTVLLVNGGQSPASKRESIIDVGTLDDVMSETCLTGTDYDLPGSGQPSSVSESDGVLYAQTQGAAAVLSSPDGGVPAFVWQSSAADGTADDPFQLYHQDAGTGIACASCHPDGQDDASIWTFADQMPGVAEAGPRRTMTLAGSLLSRAPYHWMGELADGPALVDSTYTLGMGGREVDAATSDALFSWLDGMRPVHRASAATADTLAHGQAVFQSAGCAKCHSGPLLTTNSLEKVRPGDPEMKTPSLVGLGMRSAFLHDGCAPTLEARFVGAESCTGGDLHGTISNLSEAEITDLTAYLEQL